MKSECQTFYGDSALLSPSISYTSPEKTVTLCPNENSIAMLSKSTLSRLFMLYILAVIPLLSIQAQSTAPKNVVIVLVDDLGWKDLGYAGSSLYTTPHLDELAAQATVFTQAYSAHPVCSPSRAAIMTGKNPTLLGITDWIPGQRPGDRLLTSPAIPNELALEEKTIAEYFREAGYKTFFAGKWHLGDEPYTPENQGFDINIGGIDKGSPPGGYYSPYNNSKLSDGPEGEYLTDRLTDEMIRFVQNNKDQQFLAFLSFYNVHTPIQANQEDRPSYDDISIPEITYPEQDAHTLLIQNNLDYASMVTAMDRNVGKLIRSLKDMGLWENTVFLFTSDNGGLSTLYRKTGIPTSNRPLRAGKGWCYEGGIRIPQIIHTPGQSHHIARIDAPTVHQDILPTLWSAAGLGTLSARNLTGRNVLEPAVEPAQPLYWDYPHYHGSGWTPGAAIRLGDWKLIHWYEHEKSELYNITEDEEENIDLSRKYPTKTQELLDALRVLISRDGGHFPTQNPNYKSP